ncbi:MAG: hypothetical protein WBL27_12525 [Salinimicrobium sp.]
MAKVVQISKLKLAAGKYKIPAIRSYNRLEASPRAHEFNSSVRMEIRDPLWFLCRQWQFGEFRAEDAGTPCTANILGQHSYPGAIQSPSGKRIPYDSSRPLETHIEKEEIDPTLQMRAQLGKILIRLLKSEGLQNYSDLLREEYPLVTVTNEEDLQGKMLSKSIAHLLCDGYQILNDFRNGKFRTWYESVAEINVADYDKLKKAVQELTNWFEKQYAHPDEDFWRPEHLEYSFKLESQVSARKKRVLVADQYSSGHLDWKDFDQEEINSTAGMDGLPEPEQIVQTYIPTPLKFSGMPHPRLWQLEDHTVNLGNIDATKRTLLNLLLAEFGLTYSNDWFVLPYELNINTICEIKQIKVTDVFGVHTLISPAIEDPETNWHKFVQFHQTERANETTGRNFFYLAPALGQVMESSSLDEILFLRDEMSNMVWAIEKVVISENGSGQEVKRSTPSLANFEPAGKEAKVRYVLGNTVPANWIPFIPVNKKKSNGSISNEIWLQRARLPQAPPPKSRILSEIQPVFLLEEQEVTREGITINRRFQRTRWINGKTYVWIGRKKSVGSGEGYANLSFDQLFPINSGDNEE